MHPCRFNLSVFHQFAVEGIGAGGRHGVAPPPGGGVNPNPRPNK